MKPLEMAQNGDCKNFIAHPSVQSVLTEIWVGKTAYQPGFKDKIKVKLTLIEKYFSNKSFLQVHSELLQFRLASSNFDGRR